MRFIATIVLSMVLSVAACADTISFDVNFFSSSEESVSFFLNETLPANATINSVTVELVSASLFSDASITNKEVAASTASFNLSTFNFVLQVLNAPGFGPFQYNGQLRNENLVLPGSPLPNPPYEGVANFGAVNTLIGLQLLGTANSGSCLDGSCEFTIDKDAAFAATAQNGNAIVDVTTNVSGVVRFTFDYTPNDTQIPEPTTITLVGAALLGLGLIGRRRLS